MMAEAFCIGTVVLCYPPFPRPTTQISISQLVSSLSHHPDHQGDDDVIHLIFFMCFLPRSLGQTGEVTINDRLGLLLIICSLVNDFLLGNKIGG